MALQSGKVGVSPKDVSFSGRIKGFDDPTKYLTKQEASLTYLTIIASNSFLTKTLAETTYQTIADMVNYQLKLISGTNIKRINGEDILGSGNISVLTNEIASGIYQTIQGMSNYALKSEIPDLTNYIEKIEAPGYNDILTNATASATYLTQASAVATYQTIANMSQYLTSAVASQTYTPLTNGVVSSALLILLSSSNSILFGKVDSLTNILSVNTDSVSNEPYIQLSGIIYDNNGSSSLSETIRFSSEFIVSQNKLDLKKKILSGTTDPTSSIGNDGDIYIKYEV